MANETYIKLYRKSLKNDLFNEKPFDRWHAFEYLLLKAPRFPTTVVSRGQSVPLNAGQLLVSEEKLADTFGWSRGKVRRFLSQLVSQEVATVNGTALGTVVTIENYTFYQGGEPAGGTADGTTDGTTDGTQIKKEKERERKRALPEPKSSVYRPFSDEPPTGGCSMPEEIREKLGVMFK